MYKTILEDKVTGEIVEKKSKFIATMFYVKSEKQAQDIIKEIKKQYFDARHNCYAYRIMEEDGKIIERQSDDGEPSGTAGMPMLNLLSKNLLCNVVIIVTRYFGGILLGTGGLVRAYTAAAMEAINNATITNETVGVQLEVEIEYGNLEKLKYFCEKNGVAIVDSIYENTVKCVLEAKEAIISSIIDENEIINYKVLKKVNIRVIQ